MRFVLATLDDINTLHALVHSAYRGDSARRGWTHEADLLDGQRTDVDALRQMIESPTDQVLLARDERGLAGCIAVTMKAGGLAYVGMVTVDPARQASGIGRQLLDKAERFAADSFGATRTEMTVISARTELVAWYERRGYRLTGERRPFPHDDPRFGLPTRADLEFVVLEKALTASGSACP